MSECPKLPAGHPTRTRKRSREDPTNDNNPNSTGEGVLPTATNDNTTNQPSPKGASSRVGKVTVAERKCPTGALNEEPLRGFISGATEIPVFRHRQQLEGPV